MKKAISVYSFEKLRRPFHGYGGVSFESISSLIHQHNDFYELILITQGEFQHTINNSTTVLPAGTLLLFKPGVTHQLYTEPFTSTHFVLCIEQKHFSHFMQLRFSDFKTSEYPEYFQTSISKEKLKYIEYLGTLICKNAGDKRYLADEILLLAINEFLSRPQTLDCNIYIAEIIQKFKNQLYMNTSIKDICANYPYSQPMLLQEFKKFTGFTMVDYRQKIKLNYACQLLTETDAKVGNIASALGYDSLSYFLQIFKKEYQMTPSQYRKKHSNIV